MLSKTSLRCLKHVNSQPTMIRVRLDQLVPRKPRLCKIHVFTGIGFRRRKFIRRQNYDRQIPSKNQVSDIVAKDNLGLILRFIHEFCIWSLYGQSTIFHMDRFSQNGGSQVACKYQHVLSHQLRKHNQFYFISSIVANELRTSWFRHESVKCQFPVLKWN